MTLLAREDCVQIRTTRDISGRAYRTTIDGQFVSPATVAAGASGYIIGMDYLERSMVVLYDHQGQPVYASVLYSRTPWSWVNIV